MDSVTSCFLSLCTRKLVLSLSLSLVSIRVLKFRKVKFTTCSTTCSELARGLAGVRILLNIPPTPLGRVTFTEVALKRDRWRKGDPRKGYIEIFCLWIFHKRRVRARILNVPNHSSARSFSSFLSSRFSSTLYFHRERRFYIKVNRNENNSFEKWLWLDFGYYLSRERETINADITKAILLRRLRFKLCPSSYSCRWSLIRRDFLIAQRTTRMIN